MDFAKVRALLPIPTITWNVQEICLWLRIIGFEHLIPHFHQHSVDGLVLPHIDQHQFRTLLKIEDQNELKKLKYWIDRLDEYNEYLNKEQSEEYLFDYGEDKSIKQLQTLEIDQQLGEQLQIITQECTQNSKSQYQQKTHNKNLKTQKPSNIIQFFYVDCFDVCLQVISQKVMIDTTGGSSKDILSQSICNGQSYCTIEFKTDGKFYMKDFGSKTGTFIRVVDRVEIKPGSVICIGNYQFEFKNVVENVFYFTVEYPIFVSEDVLDRKTIDVQIQRNDKIRLGRNMKQLNLEFTVDTSVSKLHAEIYKIGDRVYVDDLGSQNGTFVRLCSGMNKESAEYQITDGMIIKFGELQTVQASVCYSNDNLERQNKQQKSNCIKCKNSETDCVLLPCRHSVVCFTCSKNISICPLCSVIINDTRKIFCS